MLIVKLALRKQNILYWVWDESLNSHKRRTFFFFLLQMFLFYAWNSFFQLPFIYSSSFTLSWVICIKGRKFFFPFFLSPSNYLLSIISEVIMCLNLFNSFLVLFVHKLQDALEPYMSQKTLESHWGEYHRGYLENLNRHLSRSDILYGYTMDDLVKVTYNYGNPLPEFNDAAQVCFGYWYTKSVL